MAGIAQEYSKSKDYSKDIMQKVCQALDDNTIKYSLASNGNEVVIHGTNHTKNTIFETIYNNIDVPKVVFTLLVDIVDICGHVYIRQTTK